MTTHYIDKLEDARVLTDPFKLRLLECFANTPRTTKQVADHLGEKAPKLYRHVEALYSAGLIRLVEEKPKRGTVERYYLTVANRFEISPELLNPGEGGDSELSAFTLPLIQQTSSELRELDEKGLFDYEDEDRAPLIFKVAMEATPGRIRELRKKLTDLLDEYEVTASQPCEEEAAGESLQRVSLLVAFYEG